MGQTLRAAVAATILATLMAVAGCANPFLSEEDFAWNGNVRLETQILMPSGTEGLIPAVVFTQGSGPVEFEDYTPGYLETFLEGVFLDRGYAVVYRDHESIQQTLGLRATARVAGSSSTPEAWMGPSLSRCRLPAPRSR